jgi:hypothetical protein
MIRNESNIRICPNFNSGRLNTRNNIKYAEDGEDGEDGFTRRLLEKPILPRFSGSWRYPSPANVG